MPRICWTLFSDFNKFETNYFLSEKGINYYYNDRKDNNEIIPLINWKDKLDEDIPVLALYERVE